MTVADGALYAKKLLKWSAAGACGLLAVAVVAEGGVGAFTIGAAIGAAGSFGILALRFKSVSSVLAASGKGEASRDAFLYSLAKLGLAFLVMAVAVQMGPAGAVGALSGLFITAAAAVAEGILTAMHARRADSRGRWR